MKGRHTLKLVVVMAIVSACGIIGLLLANELDALLLVLAALPLGIGVWRWRVESARKRISTSR